MTANTAGAVFPTETVLSDGSVYRVVPVDTGVRGDPVPGLSIRGL